MRPAIDTAGKPRAEAVHPSHNIFLMWPVDIGNTRNVVILREAVPPIAVPLRGCLMNQKSSGITTREPIEKTVSRLVTGAASWAARGPAERARVAVETARSTAALADVWTDVAAGLKGANQPETPVFFRQTVWAEETATGPLATLRLLLVTAGALAAVARRGRPDIVRPPWRTVAAGRRSAADQALEKHNNETARIELELLPAVGPSGSLYDRATFGGLRATVRCGPADDLATFERAWGEEAARRPRTGGVALVLGAGNVTGLAAADCLAQIFEYGRAALLKLHPLHAPLEPVLATALAPLVDARLLAIVSGGVEAAQEALAAPAIGHVHLTGGVAAFEALVWGGSRREGVAPRFAAAAGGAARSISCELGNVTPWVVVPGRYTPRQLASQADMIAASIVNNTSFNCIATKLVVTARSWKQRETFLALVQRRLESVPARPAWYPGAAGTWESLTGGPPPADGTLPWVFRTGVDPDHESRFVEREWFVPVVAEIPLAADTIASFRAGVEGLLARLPGSLAASVTLPPATSPADADRLERLIDGMRFGVVAVNTWSALAYSLGNVPWGGYPGGTLADPKSGIGRVHDPLLLPGVRNTILRGPLTARPTPAWFPWHRHGLRLARGLVDVYGAIARGRPGLWPLVRMLPEVLSG